MALCASKQPARDPASQRLCTTLKRAGLRVAGATSIMQWKGPCWPVQWPIWRVPEGRM